jgi:predicted metal-binding membrane protein
LATLGRLWRRPTLWVEVAVAGAWAALLLLTLGIAQGEATSSGTWAGARLWVCMTETGGGAGRVGGHATAIASTAALPSLLAGGPMWGLMAFAMMVPTAMPAVRHVGGNSLYWRRRRATAEFLLGFLAVWVGFSALVLGVLASRGLAHSQVALPAALAAAALWQLTPFKWRALRSCHRSSPLPPRGWRASLGAARFGLRNGSACLASCWAMMLAVGLTGPGSLLWMGGVTAVLTGERLALKPIHATRLVAGLLAAAAIGVAFAALLAQRPL